MRCISALLAAAALALAEAQSGRCLIDATGQVQTRLCTGTSNATTLGPGGSPCDACLECPIGQYRLDSSSSCSRCPDGKTTLAWGAESVGECRDIGSLGRRECNCNDAFVLGDESSCTSQGVQSGPLNTRIPTCTYTAPVAEVVEACVDADASGDICTAVVAGNATSCGSCDYIAPVAAVVEACVSTRPDCRHPDEEGYLHSSAGGSWSPTRENCAAEFQRHRIANSQQWTQFVEDPSSDRDAARRVRACFLTELPQASAAPPASVLAASAMAASLLANAL